MREEAPFRIAQSDTYVGKDYWKWACWIDAAPADLARIISVIWILHPTFSPSRVTITTRDNQFRLDSAGWGTFAVRANVVLQDAEPVEIRQTLKLTYPADDSNFNEQIGGAAESSPPASTEKPRAKKVFISYSSEDEKQALVIQKYLSDAGTSVFNANSVTPGMPLEASIQKMIREADAFVTINSSDYQSQWVVLETKMAQAEGIPILQVPAVDDGTVLELLSQRLIPTTEKPTPDMLSHVTAFMDTLDE